MKEMNERELALREKAQEFLNQKARVKHYRISGVFNEEYGDGDTWAIFEYTDEEVARLKHLFSEALVSYLNLPNKEYSLEEIKEEANLWELKGQIEELDEMFFTPCEENYFMDPEDIDFEHPVYFYNMSCYVFNAEEKKVQGPAPFRIQLSDEEYVYLLTQQLMCRDNFTLNRLFEMNPKLAMKINRQAEDAYYGFMSFYRMPFLVTMDEVIEDVYQLDGPAPFRERLYEDDDFAFSTYTTAFVNSRKVRVVEECMRNLDYSIVFRVLSDISADELMQHLGASDYTDMIERVKLRFSGKEALNSFRGYLEAEGIAYEYAMETREGED